MVGVHRLISETRDIKDGIIHSPCMASATKTAMNASQTVIGIGWRFPSRCMRRDTCTRKWKKESDSGASVTHVVCSRTQTQLNGRRSSRPISVARCSGPCSATCRVSTRGSATTSPQRKKFARECAFGSFVTVPGSAGEIDARSSRGGTAAGPARGSGSSPQTCVALHWAIELGVWVEPPSWYGRQGTPDRGRGTALPVDQPAPSDSHPRDPYRWACSLGDVPSCSGSRDALDFGKMTRW
jgi:hypothetical protein